MYSILEPVSENLFGKVLVNLSSDTPEKARKAAKWLEDRGAWHITGGVQVPPSGIGKSESYTYYSGDRVAFEAHRETLKVLTSTDYRGEDPGLAMLYYQIQMDIFWTAMLSYLHALAIANANGITAEQFLPYASAMMSSLPKFVEFYTPRLDEGSTLVTWTDSQWAWRALSTLFILPKKPASTSLCQQLFWKSSGAA